MLTDAQALELVSGDYLTRTDGTRAVVKDAPTVDGDQILVPVHIYQTGAQYHVSHWINNCNHFEGWSVDTPLLLDCGHTETRPHSYITRGYGTNANGKTSCYACCADQERAAMIDSGRAILYLCYDAERAGPRNRIIRYRNARVTDWPGSLSFPCGAIREGSHNIAGTRLDTWFKGPDGFIWHAVQYGGNTQAVRCKRTKRRAA